MGWDHSLCPLKPPEDVQLTHGIHWGPGPWHLGGDLGARTTGREWYCSRASLHFALCLLGVTHHIDPRDKFLIYLIRSVFEFCEVFCVCLFAWELQSYPEGLCFLASHSVLWAGRWRWPVCLSVQLDKELCLGSVVHCIGPGAGAGPCP